MQLPASMNNRCRESASVSPRSRVSAGMPWPICSETISSRFGRERSQTHACISWHAQCLVIGQGENVAFGEVWGDGGIYSVCRAEGFMPSFKKLVSVQFAMIGSRVCYPMTVRQLSLLRIFTSASIILFLNRGVSSSQHLVSLSIICSNFHL